MKYDVTCEVFSPGLNSKISVLLCRPHTFNEHGLDCMIIEPLMSLLRHHDVGGPHLNVQVSDVSHLTEPQFV